MKNLLARIHQNHLRFFMGMHALQGAIRRGLYRPALPHRNHSQAGFTLIEIMVVIAIIGILATLIVPKIMGRPDEARVTAAKHDLATMSQALKLYRLDIGRYPTTEQGLQALVERPTQSRFRKTGKRAATSIAYPTTLGAIPINMLIPEAKGRWIYLAMARMASPEALHWMPISINRARPEAGFTLLELLLVLALIGTVLALATLAIPNHSERYWRENLEALRVSLNAAQDEAIFNAIPITVEIDSQGWRFYQNTRVGTLQVMRDPFAPRVWQLPVTVAPTV